MNVITYGTITTAVDDGIIHVERNITSQYHVGLCKTLMAHFHCRTRIQIQTRIQIPNPKATYAEHVSTDSDSDPCPIVSA